MGALGSQTWGPGNLLAAVWWHPAQKETQCHCHAEQTLECKLSSPDAAFS